MKSKPFYGWIIAVAAMTVLFVTNGLTISGITVFDASLLKEFGWSRADLKFRDLLTFAIAGLLGPLAGALADRFGVRRLMLFGASLLAVCMVLYGRIQAAGQMYAIHTAFAVVLASCGLIVAVILVSHWFEANRGTAIGVALVGTSLGGMVLPPLGTFLIERFGWRRALTLEAALPVLLLVLIALVVRNNPAEVGLAPAGREPGEDASSGGRQEEKEEKAVGLSYREALRTLTFWGLALAAMMTFYSILGAVSHLFLYQLDLGFTPQVAATGLSVLFGMALLGKFGFGFLADHLRHKRVLLGNLVVMLSGAILLATMSRHLFWIAVILFGLGWGGLYTMLQLLTVECFGLRAAGKILGTVTVLDAVGGGLGIWLTGLLYDRYGSYQIPFGMLSVLILVALLAATLVRRHVPRPGIAAAVVTSTPAAGDG